MRAQGARHGAAQLPHAPPLCAMLALNSRAAPRVPLHAGPDWLQPIRPPGNPKPGRAGAAKQSRGPAPGLRDDVAPPDQARYRQALLATQSLGQRAPQSRAGGPRPDCVTRLLHKTRLATSKPSWQPRAWRSRRHRAEQGGRARTACRGCSGRPGTLQISPPGAAGAAEQSAGAAPGLRDEVVPADQARYK